MSRGLSAGRVNIFRWAHRNDGVTAIFLEYKALSELFKMDIDKYHHISTHESVLGSIREAQTRLGPSIHNTYFRTKGMLSTFRYADADADPDCSILCYVQHDQWVCCEQNILQ